MTLIARFIKEKGKLEYWIGIFLPKNAPVPKGFEYCDFPEASLGVCGYTVKKSEMN